MMQETALAEDSDSQRWLGEQADARIKRMRGIGIHYMIPLDILDD